MNPFPAILQTIIWIPTRLALIFFTRIKIQGLDNLKGLPRGIIFASNHANWLDPILLPACLPMLSRFTGIHYVSLTKDQYSHLPIGKYLYGGLFFKAWGAYPAYRGLDNYKESLKHHLRLLNEGKSVMIFPQGKRIKGEEYEPAKPGIAYLAEYTGRPIVPFAIEGTKKLSLFDFFLRKNRITVTFGVPVYYETLKEKYPFLSGHELNKQIAVDIFDRVRAYLPQQGLGLKPQPAR